MKIGIMGFGVVGGGVGELIATNAESIKRRSGEEITVGKILDLRDFPDSQYKCFTKDFQDILNDPEIGVVAEVMGGTKPAYEFTKQLLEAGKSVVTSNKELVAKHGTELLKIAKDNNVNYLFEASVGGGIPIIRPLYTSLAANELTDIYGILNGTTNYILTQMTGMQKKTRPLILKVTTPAVRLPYWRLWRLANLLTVMRFRARVSQK